MATEQLRCLRGRLLIGLSGAFLGCAHHQSAPAISQATPGETIAVYTAVIDDMFVIPRRQYGHPLRQLVAADSSVDLQDDDLSLMIQNSPQFRMAMHRDMPEVPPRLLEPFLALNTRRSRIPPFAVGNVQVRLLSDPDLQQAFRPGPEDSSALMKDGQIRPSLTGLGRWAPFYRRYPEAQGILVFSRVCVDRLHGWALVYAGNSAGELTGVGYFIALQRVGRIWQVRRRMRLWIA